MSAVMRGNEFWKVMTMFQTFWNHYLNRQIDLGRRLGRFTAGQASAADVMAIIHRSFWYVVLPALWHGFVQEGGKQDQDEGWPLWGGKEIASAMVAGIPVINHAVDDWMHGREVVQNAPVIDVVDHLAQSATDLIRAAGLSDKPLSDKWVRHTIETPGYIFGLAGAGPVARTVQYLHDIYTGEEQPQGAGDFLRNLAFGPPPKKH